MLFARSYLHIFQNLIFNYLQVIRFLDASLDVFLFVFLISDNQSWLSLSSPSPSPDLSIGSSDRLSAIILNRSHQQMSGPSSCASSNWPLTVCLAALKNHQWPFIFKFSLCSSVQLIVNTSQVLKYHVKGQFKTLACSERWPSEVMFEEKIRSLSCLWW